MVLSTYNLTSTNHVVNCTHALQDGDTPLHRAARGGDVSYLEQALSSPGIDVNIKNKVSRFTSRQVTPLSLRFDDFSNLSLVLVYAS